MTTKCMLLGHPLSNLKRSQWSRLRRGITIQKLNITVKIVSGLERSAIPDTIKMSEAAGR
jgi:hypothetical protein